MVMAMYGDGDGDGYVGTRCLRLLGVMQPASPVHSDINFFIVQFNSSI